ncbi:flad1, partial [Symbiodinium sp. KB8]
MEFNDALTQLRQLSPKLFDVVATSTEVIRSAIDTFGLDATAFSFNGGKDCTVVLHLLRYALASASPPASLSDMKIVYFTSSDFPEVTAFLAAMEER